MPYILKITTMAILLIEYDARNKIAQKTIDYILSLGIFKVKKKTSGIDESFNSITDNALKEADSKNLKKYSNAKSLIADLNK